MGGMDRRISPLAADTVVAIGLFVLSLAMLGEIEGSGLGDVYTREIDAFGYLLIALQTLPLAVRRRYPVAVLVVVVGAFAVDRGLDYPSTFAGAGTLLAIHAVGSELSQRRSLLAGGGVVVGISVYTLIGAILYESVGFESVIFVLVSGTIALFLGREVHSRRAEVQTLVERAARAEAEREEEARIAVEEERARIARELHDVVAHQMVVMTVQAEGASRLARDADPRVREALTTISHTGREGLVEMRRMVGVLRASDDDELTPQPGLSHLAELVDQFTDAGLPVVLSIAGEPDGIPSGVDLSAFRIVQESLTNSLKHGGPDVAAEVRVDCDEDQVRIEVLDDGRGMIAHGGEGHGLIGMQERVALLGGEFSAGPRTGGGFAVRASLPVER